MLISTYLYSGYHRSSPAVFVWCVIGWFLDDLCDLSCLPAAERLSPGNADRYCSFSVSGFYADVCDGYALTQCCVMYKCEMSPTHAHTHPHTLVSCKHSLQALNHQMFWSWSLLPVWEEEDSSLLAAYGSHANMHAVFFIATGTEAVAVWCN